jgi:hypothetical protein
MIRPREPFTRTARNENMPLTRKEIRAPRAFMHAESGHYLAGPLSAEVQKDVGKAELSRLLDEGRLIETTVVAMLTPEEATRAGLSRAEVATVRALQGDAAPAGKKAGKKRETAAEKRQRLAAEARDRAASSPSTPE